MAKPNTAIVFMKIGGGVVLIGGGVVLIGGGVVLIGGGVGLIMLVFSSLARILGECLIIHSLLALFFFFKVDISLHTLSPLFTPGLVHSSSMIQEDCG